SCRLALLLALTSGALSAASAPREVGALRKVGSVRFETTCASAVREDLTRGVALLHSFFYDEARRVFLAAAQKDGTCGIARWGIAMTWWHPIWAAPSEDEMKA